MKSFVLRDDSVRSRCAAYILNLPYDPVMEVVIRELDVRTLEQNAKLWPMLRDISRQVEWYGRKLTEDQWKIMFTASLSAQTVVPNIENTGFVALGQSTKKMRKKEFSELLEFAQVFGEERGVKWSAIDD